MSDAEESYPSPVRSQNLNTDAHKYRHHNQQQRYRHHNQQQRSTGAYPPESCIFGEGLNLAAFLNWINLKIFHNVIDVGYWIKYSIRMEISRKLDSVNE
ncbi:hypothetical protein KSF78_0003085 [Schistosoma japonicum]|nr:hypothetical protein KSF78_0003085 [Schistosoma japonicum]